MKSGVVVNVNIGKRPYSLQATNIEDERIIRKASAEIQKLIEFYTENAKHSDLQDLISMAALHFATIAIMKTEENDFITKDLSPKLKEIEIILDQNL